LLLFFLAHLVRIVELLKKLVRVLDAIDPKIQVLDILITGPEPRRFARRKLRWWSAKVRPVPIGFSSPLAPAPRRAWLMPDDIETEDGSDQGEIDDAGS
jgi:hypothetical protein